MTTALPPTPPQPNDFNDMLPAAMVDCASSTINPFAPLETNIEFPAFKSEYEELKWSLKIQTLFNIPRIQL